MPYGLKRKHIVTLPAVTIPSSQSADGLAHGISEQVIVSWNQERQCVWCGKIFRPKWDAQGAMRFCGRSCSAKWRMNTPEHKAKVHTPEVAAKRGASRSRYLRSGTPKAKRELARVAALNPMLDKKSVEKMIETKTLNGTFRLCPVQRGGNGTGPTKTEALLFSVLGPEWKPLSIPTRAKLGSGLPTHYKIDCGNLVMKVAIEADGNSHGSRRDQDSRKGTFLRSIGWKVLRFSNKAIQTWIDTGMPADNFISMTFKSHGIRVFPFTDA